ncbi:MAG: ferrous iron transport protein B [Anaerovoracaceae bacterium]
MKISIALAGNPNSGKTTMFNELTGSNQYVGNWPGVTVEKKEGKLKGNKEVFIQDLPGIYSLSPYTLEEVVSRNYLLNEKPDAIINIIDGTNIERNLYLTTQLLELGIPTVVVVNMIDILKKNGDVLNLDMLSNELGCPVLSASALKGIGAKEVAAKAIELAKTHKVGELPHVFDGSVEHAIAHIEESIESLVDKSALRWFAIKIFERDEKILSNPVFSQELKDHLEEHIKSCEEELDDDSESIITNQRYAYISRVHKVSVKKGKVQNMKPSDKIDAFVTHRILAIPIFVAIISLIYYISVTTLGTVLTDWTNDTLFGETIIPWVSETMANTNVAPWLASLVSGGIVSGVGAVLGFVPQLLLLFIFLSILEECGYMARVAFIMDRIFRKFGLSGKSFIPMLIGSGCAVPGIMASRTIEQERDRRMTIMTTSFIPCSAKLPVIALIAGALFKNAWWVAPSAYFLGIFAIVTSGIILKKTKMFSGTPAPFVMELPAYHMPIPTNVLRTTLERGWSFVKRAGTIILAATIILWFLQAYGIEGGSIAAVSDNNNSFLASIGRFIAPIFAPLGFGHWQATVGTFTGLIAKENVVSTLGVLYGMNEVAENGKEFWSLFASDFTNVSAYSFLVFNLLCAPCFAAIGAIKKEMHNGKWTWYAIGYLTIFAYIISLMIYQFGTLITTGVFGPFTFVAILVLVGFIYLLSRKDNNKI